VAWRLEWTGGKAKGAAPVGWQCFETSESARTAALEALRHDPGIDLNVVLVASVDGVGVDVGSVSPSVATLMTWAAGTDLPAPSRHAPAARRVAEAETRFEAAGRLREVLDHVVETGDLSRIGAARVMAALEAEMIRSRAATDA